MPDLNKRQFSQPEFSMFPTPERVDPRETQMRHEMAAVAGHGELIVRAPVEAGEGILATSDIRSQHETGTSQGYNHPPTRRQVERELGFSDHPVYGMLETGYRPEPGSPPSGAHYGEMRLTMDSNVRDRTTATFGDSLDTMIGSEERRNPPAHLRNVQEGRDIIRPSAGYEDSEPYEWDDVAHEGTDYVEAQIHSHDGEGYSRIPLYDVHSVTFENRHPLTDRYDGDYGARNAAKQETLGKQFAARGIPTYQEQVRYDYQPPLPYAKSELEDQGFQKYFGTKLPRDVSEEAWERGAPDLSPENITSRTEVRRIEP